MNDVNVREYTTKRTWVLYALVTVALTALIAGTGYYMMNLSIQGASFLWIPAAFQLVAGIWLGPIFGTIAAGAGAWIAGGLNYGGWGGADLIMNPIAGGIANALLPYLLFKMWKINSMAIDSTEEPSKGKFWGNLGRFILLILGIMGIGYSTRYLNISSPFNWVVPIVGILVLSTIVVRNISFKSRNRILAYIAETIACFVSACFGFLGLYLKAFYNPMVAAEATGIASASIAFAFAGAIGWFLGDTVSGFLGVDMLKMFTSRVRDMIGEPVTVRQAISWLGEKIQQLLKLLGS